jgi:tellurite methyltransferase
MLDQLPATDRRPRADSGPHPHLSVPELPEVIHLLTRKFKALDLGCAEGTNALVLAELGFSTTAVDSCAHRIRGLQRIARARLLPLHAVRGEPHAYVPRGMYDVIVARQCFRGAQSDDRRALLRRLQSHTRRGGFNVVIAWTAASEPHEIEGDSHACGDETAALYERWKVLVHQSYWTRLVTPGGAEVAHHIGKLIARRP